MPYIPVERIKQIKSFPSLVRFLRDDLEWPLGSDEIDELVFEYEPDELGIDPEIAVKIKEIKQLRPLKENQPWGIFYIGFEPKRLPVVVLRRVLQKLVIKKRQSAESAHRNAWELHDLLFISSYGEEDQRAITFAHFREDDESKLPTLRVIGWDSQDTPLHIDRCITELHNLTFDMELSPDDWRQKWSAAFTLRYREVISTSKALAKELAALATRIRQRVNKVLAVESKKGPMRQLFKAFQETLVHDLDEDRFADMYAQTITYGLFSARCSRQAGFVAENLTDMIPVTNPFLKELLSTFLTIGGRKGKIDFDELGIDDVVQILRVADMEAVLRDFGDKNPLEDPVIHFYEDFLKRYDAHQKIKRGAFYTPRPVVSFIVRSVDEILRKDFGLQDGLADTTTWDQMQKKNNDIKIPENLSEHEPFIQILDPAAGTGTFLVEVIDLIYKTMLKKWEKDGHLQLEFNKLWNEYVPKHLLPRLYGFELMMAPYAIAHMKIGLKLFETGYRFKSEGRARIYLTNALEPAHDFPEHFTYDAPALAHEAQAVNAIKRQQRFTVVIGNPPYSVSSQNQGEWITGLCNDFKRGLEDERNLQPLSDDYIKFLRLCLLLVEQSNMGVIGVITNREYIQGIIHRSLRKRFIEAKARIYICDLHGQRGELFTTTKVDQNVFEIEKGVAVGIMLFQEKKQTRIKYGEIIGTECEKTEGLSKSTSSTLASQIIKPTLPYYFFKPWKAEFRDEYFAMPSLLDFFTRKPVTGFATHRDHFAIAFSHEQLEERLELFLDPILSDDFIRNKFNLKDTRDWQLHRSRSASRQDSTIKDRIKLCTYRPFDYRWVIYSDDILEYSRYGTMQHVSVETPALICSRIVKDESFAHVFISPYPVEKIFLSPKSSNNAQVFLTREKQGEDTRLCDVGDCIRIPRLMDISLELNHQKFLFYIYSVLHSPAYRKRYEEFLKIDFPRVPLIEDKDLFRELCDFGGELVSLHLMESDALNHHITTFPISGDNAVTKVGEKGKTLADIGNGKGKLFINKTQYFDNLSEEVWNFHIGGYQVCHKWLADRKKAGRKLSVEDIEHYHNIVVAINETIKIMKQIDEVIEARGGFPEAFSRE